jgi:hypothetical protein
MVSLINVGAIEKKSRGGTPIGLIIHSFEDVEDSVYANPFSFTMPNSNSTQNINMSLGGFNRTITVRCFLKHDSNPSIDKRTNKTVGSPKITLNEQWNYLMDEIVQNRFSPSILDKNFSLEWELTLPQYNGQLYVHTGSIVRCTANPFKFQSPVMLSITIEFLIGKNPFHK